MRNRHWPRPHRHASGFFFRLTRVAVFLVLALRSVDGSTTTLEEVPELEIVQADQSLAATLKLFPSDHDAAPTHWIVTTSDGRTTRVALRELPTLHVRHHVMHLRDRRVSRLQSAHCDSVNHPDNPAASADRCTPVDTTILLLAPTQGEPGVGGKSSLPRLSQVGVTSDVGGAIARFLVEGGTVRMSSDPPRWARRCRPERDIEC